MSQDISCAGTRGYRNKDTLTPDGHSEPGWGNGDGYGAFPQWTYVIGMSGKDQGCDCSGPINQYPGTSWGGCGDCSGGGWDCCGCCIKEWNPQNKADCCDPVTNTIQSSGIQCDPSWCPWSNSCVSEETDVKTLDRYKNYCMSNLTNTTCMSTCMQYASSELIDKAPSWCNEFIQNYCASKSKNSATMSAADATLCGCSMNTTISDECLFPTCRLSTDGQTWKTATQYQHINDPNYCSNQCKSIQGGVINGTASINVSQYNTVCGNVPLPATTTPGQGNQGTSPSDSSSESWSDWWSSFTDKMQNLTTTQYVAIGVGAFIIIVLLLRALWTKLKSSKLPSTSPVTQAP